MTPGHYVSSHAPEWPAAIPLFVGSPLAGGRGRAGAGGGGLKKGVNRVGCGGWGNEGDGLLTCSLHVSSRQLGLQRLDVSFTDSQLALQSIALPLVAALLSMSMLQADAELGHLGIGLVQLV